MFRSCFTVISHPLRNLKKMRRCKRLRQKNIKSEKIIRILPRQFLNVNGKADTDLYTRILQICEFIAGMTDSYAINLYKRLTGLEIEN